MWRSNAFQWVNLVHRVSRCFHISTARGLKQRSVRCVLSGLIALSRIHAVIGPSFGCRLYYVQYYLFRGELSTALQCILGRRRAGALFMAVSRDSLEEAHAFTQIETASDGPRIKHN